MKHSQEKLIWQNRHDAFSVANGHGKCNCWRTGNTWQRAMTSWRLIMEIVRMN